MSDRIRVLSLIKGLGPGGAEQLLLSAARVRDSEGFDEEVAYLLPWKTKLEPSFAELGVATHCFGVRREQDVRWLRALRGLVEERRYDVVHVHSPYVAGMSRLVVRSLPASRRPRLVSTEHNVWSSHARSSRALNLATFPIGDAWFAVSEEVRTSLPARLQARVEVVVHGVVLSDLEGFRAQREAVRAELRLRPDEVAVVTVANYRRQKGYPDLLAAACQVRDAGLPVRFIVIGQGPLEHEVESLHASLGLAGCVDLLGYRSDAIRVVAGCDVFALASHYEGYPVAIMEALAVGLPVVATRVGGVPEAVREGVEGLLVPPRRPDLLAEAIGELVSDTPRRIAMGKAASERGRDYDIETAVRRTEAVYREVCARPR